MERQKDKHYSCPPCYEYGGCQSKNLHRLTHCSCGLLYKSIRKLVDKQRSISHDKCQISERSLHTCARGLQGADVVHSRTSTFYVAYMTFVTRPLRSLPTLTVTVGAVHSLHKSFVRAAQPPSDLQPAELFSRT
jgi:hypothetical protein